MTLPLIISNTPNDRDLTALIDHARRQIRDYKRVASASGYTDAQVMRLTVALRVLDSSESATSVVSKLNELLSLAIESPEGEQCVLKSLSTPCAS